MYHSSLANQLWVITLLLGNFKGRQRGWYRVDSTSCKLKTWWPRLFRRCRVWECV